MKIMIASDVHGSATWCEKMLDCYNAENADRLLLLGDLLYHGPRNDLPEGYAPKAVIEMLNGVRQELLCVRGNCEAEVDQMVLSFPVMASYGVMSLGGRLLLFTHGHEYNEMNPPPMKRNDILLCGHTHVPAFARHDEFIYVNPGSVAIPKNNSPHSYLILEDEYFTWKTLTHSEVFRRESY